MNKWFILYCAYTIYSLEWDVASRTKNDENDTPEWAIAIAFIILLIFRIGTVYMAVRQGF